MCLVVAEKFPLDGLQTTLAALHGRRRGKSKMMLNFEQINRSGEIKRIGKTFDILDKPPVSTYFY